MAIVDPTLRGSSNILSPDPKPRERKKEPDETPSEFHPLDLINVFENVDLRFLCAASGARKGQGERQSVVSDSTVPRAGSASAGRV